MTSGCGDNGPCWDTGVLPLSITGTTNRYADFTYDARGNVTADSLRTYSYDPLDMSTGLSMDGREFRYIYTADDERIAAVERKLVSGTSRNITTWTLRGFDNLLLSVWTDDSTSGTRVFSWKEDEIFRDSSLLANVTPSGTRHYTLDHLGSPRLVTNSSGQPLGTQNFDPFGGGGTSDGGALQFTGHERDAANLASGALGMPDYMHARYYDSGWGRFVSVDPVNDPRALKAPQSWNRYAYVMNNPLKYTDPTGLLWFKINDKWMYLKDTEEITQVAANKDGTTTTTVIKGVSTGLVFNGTQLTMLRSDGSTRTFPAVSGVVSGWGEVHSRQQSARDRGPIPEGQYSFNTRDIQTWWNTGAVRQTASWLGMTAWPGGSRSWGTWRAFLNPSPGTNTYGRSGFSIHGGWKPGSAGCIDLCSMVGDLFGEIMLDTAAQDTDVPVDVDYPPNE